MPIYITFYGIAVSFLLLANKLIRKEAKYLFLFVFLIVILFSGLRGIVGSDTAGYLAAYNYASNTDSVVDLLFKYEPGFVAILAFHKALFNSEILYILMMSVFQALLLYAVVKNSSDKYIFMICYILLFYLNFHFNITRSAIAAMLFLYALCGKSVLMKRVALILAPFFHVTILPYYFLIILKVNKFYLLIASLVCILAISSNIDILFSYVAKYAFYQDYSIESKVEIPISTLLLIIFGSFSLFFIKNSSYLFKATGCFFVASLLLSWVYPIAYRYVITSSLFYFYYLIEELEELGLNWKKIFFWAPVALMFYSVVTGISKESDRIRERIYRGENIGESLESTYIPYKFSWNDYRIKN